MSDALRLSKVSKKFQSFRLDNIDFAVPKGAIVGLIGENGAGKTTTIDAILHLISVDSGEIRILGRQADDVSVREDIGVAFDEIRIPEGLTPMQISGIMQKVYAKWDRTKYIGYLDRFCIPASRRIRDFSKGMKAKLGFSVAMAHHPKLLILDEALNALDPVARNDVLDLLLSFTADGEHAVLFSTHITSDLKRIADDIVFIDNGRVIFEKSKDELLYEYGIMRCTTEQLKQVRAEGVLMSLKRDNETDLLVSDKTGMRKKYPALFVDEVTIDEIMELMIRGTKVERSVL